MTRLWARGSGYPQCEQHSACPACAGTQLRARYQLPYGVLWECGDCRSAFTAFFDADTLQQSNAQWGDSHHARWRELAEPEERRRTRARLRDLRHWASGGGLLEIGPNRGEFLAEAAAVGFQVSATDLFDVLAPETRQRCAAVYTGDFLDCPITPRFDVVVAFHVLEHVPDPRRFLQKARDLLAPKGFLFIEVPNYDSMDRVLAGRRWDMLFDYHVSHFSRRGLLTLIESAGLTPCRIRSHTATSRYLAGPYFRLRVAAWAVVKGLRSVNSDASPAAVTGTHARLSRRDAIVRAWVRLETTSLRILSAPLLPLGVLHSWLGRGQVTRLIARAT